MTKGDSIADLGLQYTFFVGEWIGSYRRYERNAPIVRALDSPFRVELSDS
jgi:hypothetical protein